jgi:hypothetical protein
MSWTCKEAGISIIEAVAQRHLVLALKIKRKPFAILPHIPYVNIIIITKLIE